MPALGAQQVPSQSPSQGPTQAPAFRSDINIVEIAVVAKDSNDSPITDLKKTDLRLFDNGVEQTILSFEKLGDADNPGGPAQAPSPTAYQTPYQTTGRSTARLSVILLDTLNMSFRTQADGRKAVSQMIEKLPQGRDKFAIFALDDNLHLLHDFSRDKKSLLAAVEHYGGKVPRLGVASATAAAAFDAEHPARPQGTGNGPSKNRPPSPLPLPPDAAAHPSMNQRLLSTLDAFKAIARIMKEAPGEKNLLWVTAGYTALAGSHDDIKSAMRDLAAAKLMLYPIDARGVISGLHDLVQAQNLWEFAEQTGGRVYFNSNDVASFLRAALEDSREGYVLTYAPRDYREDGSAHQVQLKTERKGVQLRYRPGYVADRAP
jgi:VWFA-related protein